MSTLASCCKSPYYGEIIKIGTVLVPTGKCPCIKLCRPRNGMKSIFVSEREVFIVSIYIIYKKKYVGSVALQITQYYSVLIVDICLIRFALVI